MTILDQAQEIQRRHEAWQSLDVEQQASIRTGLVAATERCRNHTVLVLREPAEAGRRNSIDLILGTGVLARSGRRQGILTAAHVLNAVSSLESHRRGILAIGLHGHSGTITQLNLAIETTTSAGLDNTGEYGPDIAWIDVSAQSMSQVESQAGVFYNLDRSSLQREGESREDQKIASTLVLVGYNAQRSTLAVDAGLKTVLTLPTQLDASSWKLQWSDDGGWQYGNCELYDPKDPVMGEVLVHHRSGSFPHGRIGLLDRGGDNEPTNWGGASGGGIWSLNVKTGERKHWAQLEGIAFYQVTGKTRHPTPGAPTKIRAHGPKSLQKLRDEWLSM